jgi:2-C-methyl-D-erythritol 4-phosphate cytidylyltransferase
MLRLAGRDAMVAAVKVALVIPAAGSGERLARGLPKALVDVGGSPLLCRTLSRLAAATTFLETVVLSPPRWIERFRSMLGPSLPDSLGRISVLAGGATRQQSVAAGLAVLDSDIDIVCVHDAARPLVDPLTVAQVLEAARSCGAATAAARPTDSVRRDIDAGRTEPVDRTTLWLVETPQAFRRDLLTTAHAAAAKSGATYTDDASLVEAAGTTIRMVPSLGRNLKITIETDLVLASELLRRTEKPGSGQV